MCLIFNRRKPNYDGRSLDENVIMYKACTELYSTKTILFICIVILYILFKNIQQIYWVKYYTYHRINVVVWYLRSGGKKSIAWRCYNLISHNMSARLTWISLMWFLTLHWKHQGPCSRLVVLRLSLLMSLLDLHHV